MSASAISMRYAKALLALGAEKKMVEPYSEELSRVAAAYEAEEFLRLILESPTFPLEKKQAILSDVAKQLELSEGIQQFLGLLLEKGRIEYLQSIQEYYRTLADEQSGVLRANLNAAVKPLKAQTEAIKKALQQATGKNVELTVRTDKSLLGGLQAEFAGRVFDGSIRAQLKRMADTLEKG